MKSSSKGLFLVIGGAVVLAVGVAVLYLTVLGPRGEKKRVQGEVSAWSETWVAARACLVGPDPGSSDGQEAMLLRAALAAEDITASLASCHDEIVGLRPGTDYTAGAEVDAAWEEVEEAWKALGEAHAWRTARKPNKPIAELHAALARAVAGMDEAHAELRARADLDPVDHPGRPLVTLPAGTRIADAEGTPVAATEVSFAGGAFGAFATAGYRQLLVRQAAGAPPSLIPIGAEAVPALDGSGWGMWLEPGATEGAPGSVRAGPLDVQGDPGGDGAELHALRPGEVADLHTALTSGETRVAIYEILSPPGAAQPSRTAYLARSSDGGATWTERALTRHGFANVLVDVARQRVDLLFEGTWLGIDPASAAGPLEPVAWPGADRVSGRPCADGSHTWWLTDGRLEVSEQPGAAPHPVPGSTAYPYTLACAGDRLLGLAWSRGSSGRVVLSCRPSGCSSSHVPASSQGASAAPVLSEKHGALVAVQTGPLVVLWGGDPDKQPALAPRRIARLADGQVLLGLVDWNGALHLVTRGESALHVVPLGDQV
ncbi:MAG TPA: hypothetical protein VKZ63_00975 [Kofleriaceae bacterium]|nr:hypothetical protein [Kofleriaceae bacterium]